MSVIEQKFEVPQFLYYRIENPIVSERSEDFPVLDRLRDYFFDYHEVVQRCFSAFDIPGIKSFTRKTGFEGFQYIAEGIAEISQEALDAQDALPLGWRYKYSYGQDIVPDLDCEKGRLEAHQLNQLNEQLLSFYSSYKNKVLNTIGWPMRLAAIKVSQEQFLEVDTSTFDLFVAKDQSCLYLRINNPDYFRDPAVFDGKVPQNICHNVANALAEWKRPLWIVPTTEDEVLRHTMTVGSAIEHISPVFKRLQNIKPTP